MTNIDVKLPPEWELTEPQDFALMGVEDTDDGPAVFAGWLLEDGTNLMAVSWPGGQKLCRTSPDTGWALEERFAGEQPTDPEDIRQKWWRDGMDAMAHAGREARRIMAELERKGLL